MLGLFLMEAITNSQRASLSLISWVVLKHSIALSHAKRKAGCITEIPQLLGAR